jgi:hypothetical protein
MLVVRDIFTARPGKASELARLFRDVTKGSDIGRVRVLTDFVSTHNTVVVEMEVEDVAALDRAMKDREKHAARFREAGYTELFYSGHREILQVLK